MIHDFARAIRAQLREEREARKDELARGVVTDFHEYKRLVGLIQGLDLAANMIENLARTAEHDEDA